MKRTSAMLLGLLAFFASKAFAYYPPEQCQKDYEYLINHELAKMTSVGPKILLALKTAVEKTDIGGQEYTAVVLYGKTIPAAYLVGWNVLGGSEPDSYVTPEAIAIFQKTEYQKVTSIVCPPSRDAWNPQEFSANKQEVVMWWGMSQNTEYMLAFDSAFQKRWGEIWDAFADSYTPKTDLWPYSFVQTFEVYTDTSFTTLDIYVYANFAVWNGEGATYDLTMQELRERKTYLTQYHFETKISGRDKSAVIKELETRGAAEADKVLAAIEKAVPR